MKICFLYGETATDTFVMFREAFKKDALGDISASDIGKYHLRTNHDLSDPEHAEMIIGIPLLIW